MLANLMKESVFSQVVSVEHKLSQTRFTNLNYCRERKFCYFSSEGLKHFFFLIICFKIANKALPMNLYKKTHFVPFS